LISGKEFDSSYSRNEPASFTPEGVIPGMKEAILLMKPGAKWRVVIPSSLAYGERQASPDIGPNSTLIFELELLSVGIKPATPAAPAPANTPNPTGTSSGKPNSH
jgi:FKBP-type peptidyl-prolyl cis-trans isomerase